LFSFRLVESSTHSQNFSTRAQAKARARLQDRSYKPPRRNDDERATRLHRLFGLRGARLDQTASGFCSTTTPQCGVPLDS
jgi:hypothetical protein